MPNELLPLAVTAYSMAERFVGIKEIAGTQDNPHVLAMLRLDTSWPQSDEVPWCSAFTNYVCWLLRLPRSKSLRARTWLRVGVPVQLSEAIAGFDVVVLNRGGPKDATADGPGHVGFFSATEHNFVYVLGGNQNDRVSLARYPISDVLGVRRLTGFGV